MILWAERGDRHARVAAVDDMTWTDALKVGIAQCFALIPGTSRSGATIIGAMLFGLSRKAATEFSFFLAVPTLVAAGAYDLYKEWDAFSVADLEMLGAEPDDDADVHVRAERGAQVVQLAAQDAAAVGQRGERLRHRHPEAGAHAGGEDHHLQRDLELLRHRPPPGGHRGHRGRRRCGGPGRGRGRRWCR